MLRVEGHQGLPAGSQTFFLLLQSGSVFPGACRGLGLRPLTPAVVAAWETELALEIGKRRNSKLELEGGSEGGGAFP